MNRFLVFLCAASLVLVLTSAATATGGPPDADQHSPPAQGLDLPAAPDLPHGNGDPQDADGDPHDLGGGFRDHVDPPVPVVIERTYRLLMPLFTLVLRSF